MDFEDNIRALSEKVLKMKDQIQTEEATKTAFILPFIQLLGYDIFNPNEVVPEFISDIGTKKEEKVDYAILKDKKPVIIIECKWWGEDLNKHITQVIRYFECTEAKFAIITNGIMFRFFTDIDEPNRMDKKPFFEFNITDIREQEINELKKFTKENFKIDSITSCAKELKYATEIRNILTNELEQPSEEFVKLFADKVYPGKKITSSIIEQFKYIVKKTFSQFINDMIHDRLKAVLAHKEKEENNESRQGLSEAKIEEERQIITTAEELEAYYIIKAILIPYVESKRIYYRDTLNYLNILLDDNQNKRICRLYLYKEKKHLSYVGENKKEIKIEINNIDELFKYSEILIGILNQFIKPREVL